MAIALVLTSMLPVLSSVSYAEGNIVYVSNSNEANDTNDGTVGKPFKTFKKASEVAQKNGATIHVVGDVTVQDNVTMKGTGTGDAIVLENGAKLSVAEGEKLMISGYDNGIIINEGGVLSDGEYVLDGNEKGFNLKGKIEGSSGDRSKLKISSVSTAGKAFDYTSNSLFKNATINVQAKSEQSEQCGILHLDNTDLTTRGVWYYAGESGDNTFELKNKSVFHAYKAKNKAYRQAGTINTPMLIDDSTMIIEGSRLSTTNKINIRNNSTVKFVDYGFFDGFNIHEGEVVVEDSTLIGEGNRSLALFGAGRKSKKLAGIKFTGNSVVNTPAKDLVTDNGRYSIKNCRDDYYVVTGGSFKMKYDKEKKENSGFKIVPTNGPENGNEELSYFKLSDPSVQELNPINKKGNTYTYKVARASDDGNKYVWTPAANVTYKLYNDNATFADGSKEDKHNSTIRGYKLSDVVGNEDIGTPKANKTFLGWFYKDKQDKEQKYNNDLKFDKDTVVYAKWGIQKPGPSGPLVNPNTPKTDRVNGKDRIDTAIEVSKKYYNRADTVIVVRNDLFPDSMTSSVLAKLKDAPILLNSTLRLDKRVKQEIKRLGAREIIIVGGVNSISDKVREELKIYDADQNVERIAGRDRYATSEMIARRAVGIAGIKHTGVVASGEVFPDALSVGAFASREAYPILLVRKNSVPVQITNVIKDLKIDRTYIAGGRNTVSTFAESQLPNVVERMAGKTRYETSVAIAKSKFKYSDTEFVTSGEEFADSLVISPISGKYNRPTLLVGRYGENKTVRDHIMYSKIKKIIAIGGELYVPYRVIKSLI